MNSLYGATANEYFRFFKWDHAASITGGGQFALRTIENNIDRILNEKWGTGNVKYLVYIDTDSCYFELDAYVKKMGITKPDRRKFLEDTTKDVITPIINEMTTRCAEWGRSKVNSINFKLEIAAPAGGIWCLPPGTKVTVDGDDWNIEDYYAQFNPDELSLIASYDRDMGQMVVDRVAEVHRKPYKGQMYTFTAENGQKVRATEDHIMFVRRGGLVIEIPAKEVLMTDELMYADAGNYDIQ